jgi:hypothetical protein
MDGEVAAMPTGQRATVLGDLIRREEEHER